MANKKKKNTKKQQKPQNRIEGVINITASGMGFVATDQFEEDIKIESGFLNTALNKDLVEIVLLPKVEGERLSGEVVNILERNKTTFIGTIDRKPDTNFFFLVPDDNKMYVDIFVPRASEEEAKNDYKAVVEMVGWESPKKNPEGKLVRILGPKGDHNVEMESIVIERGFEPRFPKEIEEEAEAIKQKEQGRLKQEVKKRRDCRDVATFTIDPDDAKDFDDALSFKKVSGDTFEVGVHIADVSHYVKPKSAIDVEAINRGFSVYLVDRTIPMLPEVLSNDLCSLNPNEDKLAFSTILTMSKDGTVKDVWFGKTVISSDKRFSYREAQDVIDNKEGPFYEELNTLNEIARSLQGKRDKRGALQFENEEVKFELDKKGKPVKVHTKEMLETNKLIEEFMVLSNEKVAELFSKMDKTRKNSVSVYRVHDIPKRDAFASLTVFLSALGYDVRKVGEKVSSEEINAVTRAAKGKPEEYLVNTAVTMSLSKAIYSVKNIGHFGLALSNYTHFTSPIRRYPDLIVHRLLIKHLQKDNFQPEERSMYERLLAHFNKREMDAADAERDSVKAKQVEYMLARTDKVFDGIISGITGWGIYVEELTTKTDGLVRLREMKDDFYELDEAKYAVVGTRTGKKYSLGDKVKVKVVDGDIERRELEYIFV